MKFYKNIIIFCFSILIFSCKNINPWEDSSFSVTTPFSGECIFIDKTLNLISIDVIKNQKIIFANHNSFNPVIFLPNIHCEENQKFLKNLSIGGKLHNICYGIIYPINTQPDISGGIVAKVFQRLIFQSYNDKKIALEYCNYFNWQRLYEELKKYEINLLEANLYEPHLIDNNDCENLFNIDIDTLVSDIANNFFTKHSIKFNN